MRLINFYIIPFDDINIKDVILTSRYMVYFIDKQTRTCYTNITRLLHKYYLQIDIIIDEKLAYHLRHFLFMNEFLNIYNA